MGMLRNVIFLRTTIFTVLFLLSMMIGLNRLFNPLLELNSYVEKLKDRDITDYQPVAISTDNKVGD